MVIEGFAERCRLLVPAPFAFAFLADPSTAPEMHENAKAQQVRLRAAVEQRWREGGQTLGDG